uniref:Putative aldolase n=1 Tax=Arabidopsis thaliana TaxID=3702 RepID=Q8LB55_ARATH|nr:putative aldolase [Arabidopsis thaliana]
MATASIFPAAVTVTRDVTSLLNPSSLIIGKSLSPSKFSSIKSSVSFSRKTLTPIRYSSSPADHSPATAVEAITNRSKTSLKSRLRGGETLYGLFLLSFSPTLAEIAAHAGYDYVVVDMEHGPGGIPEALDCIRALNAAGTSAILRLPENSPTWAKKALDLGPQGIMFPMIESRKDATKAVSYCRFPPDGIRGSAHTVVRASNYGIDEGYLSNYAEEILIMCQVESGEGVKKADEIAAVDGVDCVQMGPLDLSASLGYLWDPGHKKVREMMKKAEKSVLTTDPAKGGAYLSGFAMPHDGAGEIRGPGYHMVAGAVDVGLFRNAAVEDVRRFKMGLVNESDSEDSSEHDKDVDDEKYWSE